MSDAPETIRHGNPLTGEVAEYTRSDLVIRKDDPDLLALVEAVKAMRDFDGLPLMAKRPDVFEIRVRKPLLRAIATWEEKYG